MSKCKYYCLLMLVVFVVNACGGAKRPPKQTTDITPQHTEDTISLPDTIDASDRKLWEKQLLLMDVNHPQRLMLRDKIAASIVREFKETDPDKQEERLSLFEEALFLHDASDFAESRVVPEVAEMAEWVVDVFERRGDEAVVLAALRYLMMAKPEAPQYEEMYLELKEWSKRVRETIVDKIQRVSSQIDIYTEMVRLVPDKQIVNELAELHLERYKIIQSVFKSGIQDGDGISDPRQILMHGRALQSMPLNIIHIFFLVGNPVGARKYLEGLVAEGDLNSGYLEMLDRIAVGEDLADAYYSLARSLIMFDPRAALKAYILARKADSEDYRFSMNIGQLFDELECSECAVEFYMETARISPSEEVYTQVIELVTKSLTRLHYGEQVAACKRVIRSLDDFVKKAIDAYPDENTEIRAAASSLLYSMGEVEFDDGEISAARRHFSMSNDVKANVPALIKLQEVFFLLNDFQPAMEILEKARAVNLDGIQISDYLKALILEKQGDLLLALGKKDDAKSMYKEALMLLEYGDEFMDSSPAVAIRRGIILHRLGEIKNSQAAFTLAIRLDPDRAETYGTLISFLVVQGRLNDAVEIYRLAYNQDRIKAMWKIYYSLWVEGLARRSGQGSVDLAKGYLESSNGESWQDDLAKFFCGKMTLDELRKNAQNTGQQVEVDYYGALALMSEGKNSEAKNLLDAVISSNLLGFFEYRMARELLRNEFDVTKTP
jgi:tetratricopeptide (TPR) repeat protein